MSPATAKVSPNEKPTDAELRQKQLAAVLSTVRVMDRAEVIAAVGVSPNTWERMEKDGETPPVTQLSKRRIGYRVVDLVEWLDARRQGQGTRAIEARAAKPERTRSGALRTISSKVEASP